MDRGEIVRLVPRPGGFGLVGIQEVMATMAEEGLMGRIEVNPKVMLGKPVIRGTRIPVELILRKLGEGATVEDLLDAYPHLCREDIQAALAYAARTLACEETVTI